MSGANSGSELRLGAKVLILNNDNVSQRAPKYIGQIGTIIDVPVHPKTWFKISFADGQIITFRPTALEVVPDEPVAKANGRNTSPAKRPRGDEDTEDKEVDDKKKKKTNPQSKVKEEPKEESEGTDIVVPSNDVSNQDNGSVLLNTIDPDTWIGRVVVVKGGKDDKLMGKVLRSGNGWVQIATMSGEVAKRAYDLYVYPEESPVACKFLESLTLNSKTSRQLKAAEAKRSTKAEVPQEQELSGKTKTATENGHDKAPTNDTVLSAAPSTAQTDPLDADVSCDTTASSNVLLERVDTPANSSEPSSSSPVPMAHSHSTRNRPRNEVEDYLKPFAKPRNVDAPRPVNRVAAASAKSGKGKTTRNGTTANIGTTLTQNQRGLDAMQAAFGVDTSTMPSNGPKISDQAIALKRVFIQKFVDRYSEKLKDRPDLGYWLSLVRGGLVDPRYEMEMAIDPLDIFCTYCKVEYWPGARFCWNEWCPSSQIYYRLNGARGSAPDSQKPISTAECRPLSQRCKYFAVENNELVYIQNETIAEVAEMKVDDEPSNSPDLTQGNPIHSFLWDAPRISLQYNCFLTERNT